MVHLDTNVVISIINGCAQGLASRFLATVGRAPLAISSIVVFELRYG